ncbi:hypothetical protein J6590_052844 [Homalodisca vitripennis]|nr:hypothetical protein J6590_052844 [Homalodisca vitripennis]
MTVVHHPQQLLLFSTITILQRTKCNEEFHEGLGYKCEPLNLEQLTAYLRRQWPDAGLGSHTYHSISMFDPTSASNKGLLGNLSTKFDFLIPPLSDLNVNLPISGALT